MATLTWNLNGFFKHLPELQLIITKHKPDYICLQETHLKESDNPNLKGYDCFRKDRGTDTYGGVAIFVDSNNVSSEIPLNTNLEAIAVRTTYPEPCTICSIYLPPNSLPHPNELENLIKSLPAPFILTGDFNAHNPLWNGTYTNHLGRIVEGILDEVSLLNDGTPTHFSSRQGTFSHIDLTLCDPKITPNLQWHVLPLLYGSDHFPIIVTNTLKLKYTQPTNNTDKWNLDKANWLAYTIETEKLSIDLNNVNNIDSVIEIFTNNIKNIAQNTIGTKNQNKKNKCVPWWNTKCKEAIKNSKAALYKFKKSNTVENLIEFKKQRAIKRRIIIDSKTKSWQQFTSTITPETPIKTVWNKINSIKGKYTTHKSSTLIHNNTTITDPKQIANTLADTFEELSSNSQYDQDFMQYKNEEEKSHITIEPNNNHPLNVPFKLRELQNIIKDLKPNKSAGPDSFPFEFYKYLSLEGKTTLLKIYNIIWTMHIFPNSWREVIIIPILKSRKKQTDPKNYRPIALSNTICKIMEKMVNKRLSWFIESEQLLANEQCGFRPGRSTTDQLFILGSEINNAIKNKQHLVAVSFDIEKAYDRTWKHLIIKNLKERNIQGNILHFVQNFLTNRRFRVKTHGHFSDYKQQDNGLPQGAGISTTLFSLAIDSVAAQIVSPSKILLFADDIIVYCIGKNIKSIERLLQSSINKLQDWTKVSGFKFSTSKTHGIHFCRLRKHHPDPRLKIFNTNIQFVEKLKILGMTFDKKLSWKPHVQELKSECFKRLNILKSLANHNWGAHPETLLTIYRMLIRSKIDYGCIVYNSASKRILDTLNVIQHKALRIATGALCTSPILSIQVISSEKPLQLRRTELLLKYILNIASKPQHPTFSKIFHIYNDKPTLKILTPYHNQMQNQLNHLSIEIPIQHHIRFKTHIPPWLTQQPV